MVMLAFALGRYTFAEGCPNANCIQEQFAVQGVLHRKAAPPNRVFVPLLVALPPKSPLEPGRKPHPTGDLTNMDPAPPRWRWEPSPNFRTACKLRLALEGVYPRGAHTVEGTNSATLWTPRTPGRTPESRSKTVGIHPRKAPDHWIFNGEACPNPCRRWGSPGGLPV